MSPAERDIDDDGLAETMRFLIVAGTQLVHELLAQDAPATEKAEPYERYARALRRSVLLARHVNENAAPTRAARRAQARRKIIRAVEDDIIRAPRPDDEIHALRAELHERLDAPEIDEDVTNRPIDEIIQEIRRDLGLDNQPGAWGWPRRTPKHTQEIAAAAARAAESRPDPPAPEREPHQPEPEEPEPEEPEPEEPEPDDPFGEPLDPSIRPNSLLAHLLRAPVRDG